MYCVKFLDRLRRKFGLFTEGNEENEGFRSGEATGEAVSFAYSRRPPRRTPYNCRFAAIRVFRGQKKSGAVVPHSKISVLSV